MSFFTNFIGDVEWLFIIGFLIFGLICFGLVAYGFYILYDRSTTFREAIETSGSDLFNIFKNLLDSLKDVLGAIDKIRKAFEGCF